MGTQNTVQSFFYPDMSVNEFMFFQSNRLFLPFALVNLQLGKTTLH